MTCNSLQIGSIGFSFNIQVISNFIPMDVSGAITKKIYFQKPDGTKINHNLSFLSDGKDGKMLYITQSGDIDQAGKWQMQANIVTSSSNWWTSIEIFNVQSNIN